MSTKRSVGKALLAPLVAAGTSAAASYLVKKGPEFVEETLLPWLREAAQSAGDAAEKLPDKARSTVSSGGDLAEQLTGRARDATGVGGGETSGGGGRSDRDLSQDELSRRSDERAKRRAQRRRKTKKTSRTATKRR